MNFNLTILGSSSALPTSKRFPTAHVLNIHERFFLIDCGEGTQIQLRRLKLKFSKINHIFISHLHGDHVFGLFGLLSTFHLLDRKIELHIFGPPEISILIEFFQSNFAEQLSFKIVVHAINLKTLKEIFHNKQVTVEAFPLKHRIPTLGYIFREHKKQPNIRKDMIEKYKLSLKDIIAIKKGADWRSNDGIIITNKELTLPSYIQRSYAFCTDTLYRENIVPFIKNVDILYHEATFLHQDKKIAKETYHSTTIQAATLAKKARVKKLIIGHFSSRYKDIDMFLNEARTVFPETYTADEGETYNIELVREEIG